MSDITQSTDAALLDSYSAHPAYRVREEILRRMKHGTDRCADSADDEQDLPLPLKYTQSDMERARAQGFSSAADTACNQWNGLRRTQAWCAMTGEFQLIWKNLRDISDDYHKLADELETGSNP